MASEEDVLVGMKWERGSYRVISRTTLKTPNLEGVSFFDVPLNEAFQDHFAILNPRQLSRLVTDDSDRKEVGASASDCTFFLLHRIGSDSGIPGPAVANVLWHQAPAGGEPLQFDSASLANLLKKSADRRVTLWVVLYEDVYETRFGDGFFQYPGRAFFDPAIAETFAAWVAEVSKDEKTTGFNAEVLSVSLSLDEAGKVRATGFPEGIGKGLDEGRILKLLNGTDPEWQKIVESCRVRGR